MDPDMDIKKLFRLLFMRVLECVTRQRGVILVTLFDRTHVYFSCMMSHLKSSIIKLWYVVS